MADTSTITEEDKQAALQQLREICLARGFTGIKSFSGAFRHFDKDFSREIREDEFRVGLKKYGIDLTTEMTTEVFKHLDRDRDGRIDFHEFYYRLAPPLVGRRAKVVSDVFHKLDKSGDGFLQAYDIVDLLSDRVQHHPKYVSGQWTAIQVINSLLAAFEQPESRDGVVSLQEFLDYYAAVSMCVEDDNLFEKSLRECWGVSN